MRRGTTGHLDDFILPTMVRFIYRVLLLACWADTLGVLFFILFLFMGRVPWIVSGIICFFCYFFFSLSRRTLGRGLLVDREKEKMISATLWRLHFRDARFHVTMTFPSVS